MVEFKQDQSHPILTEFPKYLEDYRRLEIEYYKIRNWPIIGFIRQMHNLRQRSKLTKAYEKKMKEWGI